MAPGDRVSAVIARDERAVEVLAAASPHFARLRSPALRRVMARLVTVEQAARIAGLDPAALVARLNRALGGDGESVDTPAPPPAPPVAPESDGPPPHLAALPADRVVELDVRDELRAGREPFSRIMEARRALPAGSVLRLRAIFEPVPLYAVMAKQGLDHWTERLADDDWRVWFHPPVSDAASAAERPDGSGGASPSSADETAPEGPSVAVIDVRGLEPPEPMMRTLAALEALAPGGSLLQVNERVPRFLLPQVEQRGFTWEVLEEGPERVRILFRRPDDPAA